MMLGVALTQVILESRLAQFASRFTAMTIANNKAHEMFRDYNLKYHSAKRAERDEAAHELVYNRSRL
jgi:F0F1-type ATP synthase gamma subunit